MKKFTGLFLSILMILSVCTVSVSADDSPISGSVAASESNTMFNNLSDTIWKFDNVKQDVTEENSTTAIIDGSTKDQNVKYHMGGYYREAQSFLNTTDSKVTYDTAGSAMKIDIQCGYHAVLNGDNVLNDTQGATQTKGGDTVYLKSYMDSSSYDAVNVRFTMKAAATSGRAAFSLRGTANGSNVANHYEIVALDTGKILLCGVEVASYTTDQWYTFDVRVNMKEHYARLYLTSGRDGELMNGRTTANTVFFDSCFDDLRATNSGNYTSLTITDVTQIMMSFVTTATATWYMGEWYQNAMTSAPRPTYESLNSDFSGETS